MYFSDTTPLINLPVFALGAVLYAMLLYMVLRYPVRVQDNSDPASDDIRFDFLLIATGVLGLIWNLGGLIEWLNIDFFETERNPFFTALQYAALGFLPAAVVHSVFHKPTGDVDEGKAKGPAAVKLIAYCLSVAAAVLHFYSAIAVNVAPSSLALRLLTFGYLIILAVLFLSTLRQSIQRKAVWATALAVFAVSALHLSQPHDIESFWPTELLGHHASLPLALAILYQDFRFAFADLLLRRLLSVVMIVAIAAASYWTLVSILYQNQSVSVSLDSKFIAAILTLWVATALVYPFVSKLSGWLVDRVILRRVNYQELKVAILKSMSSSETVDSLLKTVCAELQIALTANRAYSKLSLFPRPALQEPSVFSTKSGAEILIPTTDQPNFKIVLENFMGGRRLLSDELEMLKDVAIQAARRIDALRVTHERCEQELREQEFSKLTTEAELRALRAQVNPHFLFNALTTISYLINIAPDKANATLMRLTKLLRGVLRSTDEFLSLGDEISLIESYLEIERARFEERLIVTLEVPEELMLLQIPTLLLQPLVENSIKHGITPKKEGGEIKLVAAEIAGELVIEVSDTGAGVDMEELSKRRLKRIGMNNVEERLKLYFDDQASLSVSSRIEGGTKVKIKIKMDRLVALPQRKAAA